MRFLLPILAALALTACQQPAHRDEPHALANADEWPLFGRTGAEQHYSPVGQINTGNVADLKLSWFADLPSGNSATGPIMAEGKLFATTGHGHIRAFDAATGKPLWDYDTHAREASLVQLSMGWGPKGLAYWQGRVYLGTHDGRVVAVNAADGTLAWEQRDYPATDLRYTDGPVRVFDGKVIIGHGGADYSPIRGFVTAYDAATGKRLWRFHTVPGDPARGFENKAMAMAAKTWTGQWWKHGGGGTAWNAFSYDPALGLIYIGVGNGFPYNQAIRSPGGGDNLFLSSIVAVRADTGEYVWHYQLCPGDQWDCTATQDMTLATIEIDGKPRKVLLQAPKNGFFYVIDRTNGQLISTGQYADKVTWASRIDAKTGRPVENPGIRYHGKKGMFELWPGLRGAHSWLPQAYSPRTGLVYIPVIEGATLIGDEGVDLKNPPIPSGVNAMPDPELPGARRSFLKAWDPIRQKEAWRVPLPGNWPGGVLATAGDVLFQGTIDGRFVARDARTGKELWSFAAQAPIVAPPISYRVGGKQYVTVLTGNGAGGGGTFSGTNSSFNADYRLPRRILTFALDGNATLPPAPPAAPKKPLDDPGFRPDPTKVALGARAFGVCMSCHGWDAKAAGTAPELRTSPLILDAKAFRTVVREGALVGNGMPAFPRFDDATLDLIRHYLRTRSQQLATEEQQD